MKLIIIALRNLNRQKKRTFLLGGAIAFGIMIVTVINGFTGSFVRNVAENFSNLFAGHIFIEGVEKDEEGKTTTIIRNDEQIRETIAEENIPARFLTRRTEFRGTLLFQGESVSQNIVGAEWNEESFFRERLVLMEGDFSRLVEDPRGIIISREIADLLKVELGDRILVRNRTITGQQNVGEFNLVGVSHDPGLFGALSAYANMCYVNELLDIACDEYKTLGIMLPDLSMIDEYADPLYEALSAELDMFERSMEEGDDRNPVEAMFDRSDEETWEGTRYRFYTLNDVLSEADQIVRILNTAGIVILLILFVIIMVGIANTFRMIMIERTKEIGTMRALGMQRPSVQSLFLLEALLLALGGAVAGLAAAGIIMFVLSRIFWGLETPLYILLKNGYMTFRLIPLQMLLHFSIVAALTVVAAFFPARKAAQMHPVDALRAS